MEGRLLRFSSIPLIFLLVLVTSFPDFTALTRGQEGIQLEEIWGLGNDDEGRSVSIDSAGSIYVAGKTGGSDAEEDVLFLKFSSVGNLLLQMAWEGNSSDGAEAIAIDSEGAALLAGRTDSFGAGDRDILLLKFSPLGQLIWERTYGGANYDTATGIATVSVGDIYVAGRTDINGSSQADVLLFKLNSSGDAEWSRSWGGEGFEEAGDIAIDPAGDIYLAGRTSSFGAGNIDVFILKFDASGNLLWQRTWGNGGDNSATDVAADSAGNIYVTGNTFPGEAILLRLDSSGNLVWQRAWAGDGLALGGSVTVDFANDVYLTGYTVGPNTGLSDVVLLKVSSTGDLIWQVRWGSNRTDTGTGITLDPSGEVYATGIISEGPPFNLSALSDNMLMTDFPLATPGFPLGTPSLSTGVPNGNLSTLAGSEAYSGMTDVFVIKYSAPTPTPTTVFPANATPIILAALVYLLRRSRRA